MAQARRAGFPASNPDSVCFLPPRGRRGLGPATLAPPERDLQGRFQILPRGITFRPRDRHVQLIGSPGDAPLSTDSSGIRPSAGTAPRTSTSLWKPAMLRGPKLTTATIRRPTRAAGS